MRILLICNWNLNCITNIPLRPNDIYAMKVEHCTKYFSQLMKKILVLISVLKKIAASGACIMSRFLQLWSHSAKV